VYDGLRVPRGSTGVGQSNFAPTTPRWEKSRSEKSLSSTSGAAAFSPESMRPARYA